MMNTKLFYLLVVAGQSRCTLTATVTVTVHTDTDQHDVMLECQANHKSNKGR